MAIIAKLFDAKDSSFELHDVAGAGLIMAHAGAAAYQAIHGVAVDFQAFGVGGAALISAIGGAGWMKGRQRAVDPTCQSGGNPDAS